MKIKKFSSLLFVTLWCALLSGCTGIQLKNQTVCTVAGVMAAGMNCVGTVDGEPSEMNIQEVLAFLEPDESENRSGAMCMSQADFTSMKTTIDVACELLGSACTVEFRKQIEQISTNIGALSAPLPKELIVLKVTNIPKKGDRGADVVVLQKQLEARGFSPGSIDGIFGPKVESAVSRFQKSIGQAGSGVIGPITLRELGIEVSLSDAITGKETITKDLKGKKSRFLHPNLRLLLEAKLFPGGVVPKCFLERDLVGCVLAVSRAMESLGIRESGNNRGTLVGYIQGIIGGYTPNGNGDAWCMSTVQCIVAFIEDYFQVESPLPDSEHCVTVHNGVKKISKLLAEKCEAGTVWNAQHGAGPAGHTGIVLEPLTGEKMSTFEGNTGSSSIREGDGAYFKTRNQKRNGGLVTLGFAYLYPENKLPA